MLKFNGNLLKVNGSVLNSPTIYSVTCATVSHGQVIAVPESGLYGTTVNIYSIPEEGYVLSYYLVNGIAISGNTFTLTEDTVITGVFTVNIPSVTINGQTWMSANLDIDDGQGGIVKKTNVTSCGVNIGTQYYYTKAAAERIASTLSGWHLPSEAEWQALINYAGNDGKPLKSTTGWGSGSAASTYNGTNTLGFNLPPTGWLDSSKSLHIGTSAIRDATETKLFTADYDRVANFYGSASITYYAYDLTYTSIRLMRDL